MPTLTTTDGLTIAWDDWGQDGRDPALPPVVLHHGFAVDARINFLQPGVVDALVRASRHVVGLDARATGGRRRRTTPSSTARPAWRQT